MSEETEHERMARKSRSEAILHSEGIATNPNLPAIESADEIRVPSPDEIARRALCLLIVAGKGSGLSRRVIRELISRHGEAEFFTPKERAFIRSWFPSVQTKMRFSWRSEAAWVLLWALGFVRDLGLPFNQIQPDDAVRIVEAHGLNGLVANAKPRTAAELLDEADLIYRCHWAIRHSDMDRVDEDGELEADITKERHHALNWLIGYQRQSWDGVSTDT